MLPKTIADDLREKEELLWYGQPRTDFLFVPYDWFLVAAVVGCVGIVGALFLVTGSNLFRDWMSVSFVVAAIAIALLRFPLDLLKRQNTYYFVTDQRVAIKIDTLLERTTRSVEYDSNFRMTPIDGPRGSTTIYFGSMSPLWSKLYPPNYPLMDMFQPPAYIFLDNAYEVMEIIIEAKRTQ